MWRNLLLVFVGYILIRGFLAYRKLKKSIKQNQEMFENQTRKSTKPEGEVEVVSKKTKSSDSKQNKNDDGQYVDFEEIE
jgi:hypothetical protein